MLMFLLLGRANWQKKFTRITRLGNVSLSVRTLTPAYLSTAQCLYGQINKKYRERDECPISLNTHLCINSVCAKRPTNPIVGLYPDSNGGRTLPSYNQLFHFGCLRSNSRPDIHGEDTTGAVEQGWQRAHHGRHYDRNHQTSETSRREEENKHWNPFAGRCDQHAAR